MYKKDFYSGQAIAIVMIVLIVATVLGASLYSRTLVDQQYAVKEQDSNTAYEQADSLLDPFLYSDVKGLEDYVNQVKDGEVEGVSWPITLTSVSEIENLLSMDSINIDTSSLGNVSDWCEGDTSEASSLKMTIDRSTPNESIDVRVGASRIFNLEGATISGTSCSLNLKFESRGNTETVFAIKKVYVSDAGEVKEYSNLDIIGYCLSATGNCSDTTVAPATSVEKISPSDSVSVNLKEVKESIYKLREVRVIPLLGTLGVSYSLSTDSCISSNFDYIKINTGVNCYGSYREKQLLLPGSDSTGYSTLFDYSIYNNGVLGTD